MNFLMHLKKLTRKVYNILRVRERRKKAHTRGNIPWYEPYERRSSKHKYKE